MLFFYSVFKLLVEVIMKEDIGKVYGDALLKYLSKCTFVNEVERTTGQ